MNNKNAVSAAAAKISSLTSRGTPLLGNIKRAVSSCADLVTQTTTCKLVSVLRLCCFLPNHGAACTVSPDCLFSPTLTPVQKLSKHTFALYTLPLCAHCTHNH